MLFQATLVDLPPLETHMTPSTRPLRATVCKSGQRPEHSSTATAWTLLVGLLLGAALAHFVDSALMRHLALLDRMAI